MKQRNLIGIAILAPAPLAESAGADNGDPTAITNLPQLMIYAGLAVVCPGGLDRATRIRLGSQHEADSA